MTQSQLKEANEIVYQIKEKKQQIQQIQELKRRMKEITDPYAKYVKIQLGEAYVYTPNADVQIDEFRKFLNAQEKYFETYIKNLETHFEEL